MLRRREIIEQTISADQEGSNNAIRVGNLYIQPEEHIVSIQNATLDLTRIEIALLYLLVRNAGRVFSRAYLVDTIWRVDYVSGDRSVDNTILRLRKKLKTVGDCIETVWGVGYRWKRQCLD